MYNATFPRTLSGYDTQEEILRCSMSPRTIDRSIRRVRHVYRPSPRSLRPSPHSTFRASVIRSRTKSVRTSMGRARSSSFFLVGEPTIVHLRIYRRLPPSASKCALPSPPSFLAHPPNGPPMQNVRVQPVRPPGLADLTAVRPPQAGARTRPLHVVWIGGGCRPKG